MRALILAGALAAIALPASAQTLQQQWQHCQNHRVVETTADGHRIVTGQYDTASAAACNKVRSEIDAPSSPGSSVVAPQPISKNRARSEIGETK